MEQAVILAYDYWYKWYKGIYCTTVRPFVSHLMNALYMADSIALGHQTFFPYECCVERARRIVGMRPQDYR